MCLLILCDPRSSKARTKAWTAASMQNYELERREKEARFVVRPGSDSRCHYCTKRRALYPAVDDSRSLLAMCSAAPSARTKALSSRRGMGGWLVWCRQRRRSFRVDGRSVPDLSPLSPNRPTRCSQGSLRTSVRPSRSEHYLIMYHVTICPGRLRQRHLNRRMFLSQVLLESCQPNHFSNQGTRGLFQEGAPRQSSKRVEGRPETASAVAAV